MNRSNEIIIIGGGIIGLAISLELHLRGVKVTVLCRNNQQAATLAAAGMLAPQAENLTNPQMLELCLRSRWYYPEWIRKLEELTGADTGYWPCGILAPKYQKESSLQGIWLEKDTIRLYQPGIGEEIVGGWWYPEDGQVDSRALYKTLQQAVQNIGIDVHKNLTLEAIEQKSGKVYALRTNQGEYQAQKYIVAAGAWAQQLLPLPIKPIKGQMLGLRMPRQQDSLPLQKVLFGPGIYLVPRKDGGLVIGATVEDTGFKGGNTPQGINHLLAGAMRLYPSVGEWPIEKMWWGYRPGTLDELPILGVGPCDNLILATGHYRNGILLAPVTASLIADLVVEGKSDPLLEHFHLSRFYPKSMISLPTSVKPSLEPCNSTDELIIAGKRFTSRLMTGTGKYRSITEMQQSVMASGCQIVTVAVRRVQTKAPGHEGLAEALDWNKIWMLPNTAGCKTAEEAVRVARLGREMAKLLGQEDNNFVKLEVIPDSKYLLPDPIGTLEAAQQLVKEGFAVLPYINADPLLAKRLEEVGCVTVMPLGSPIGSGQGIRNAANIAIIIEEAKVPVVVDAGIGTPSEAAMAMEMGADALLINSAIALAQNAPLMAEAMSLAAIAGRKAYQAGRMPIKPYASASSPVTGTITHS